MKRAIPLILGLVALISACDDIDPTLSDSVSPEIQASPEKSRVKEENSIENILARLKENLIPAFKENSRLTKGIDRAEILESYLPDTASGSWKATTVRSRNAPGPKGDIHIIQAEYIKDACSVHLVLSDTQRNPMMLMQYQQVISDIASGRKSDLQLLRIENEYGLLDTSSEMTSLVLIVGNRLLYLFQGEACKPDAVVGLANKISLKGIYLDLRRKHL